MRRYVGLAAVLVVLWGCGGDQDATVLSTQGPATTLPSTDTTLEPAATVSDEPPIETTAVATTVVEEVDVVFDPETLGGLGDCFNEGADVLVAVDCAQLHDYQIILADGIFAAPDGASMPTDEEWDEWEQQNCPNALDDFIGVSDATETIGTAFFGPTDESWAEGDRSVWCVGYVGDTTWTGSLADR